MNRDEVDLRGELASRPDLTYHIYSAYHGGRAVAVKVFEGHYATKVSNILCNLTQTSYSPSLRIVERLWLYLRNYCMFHSSLF